MLSRMLVNSAARHRIADAGFDPVAELGRFLNARARPRAHVQLELAAVHGREKVLAQPGKQSRTKRCKRERSKW